MSDPASANRLRRIFWLVFLGSVLIWATWTVKQWANDPTNDNFILARQRDEIRARREVLWSKGVYQETGFARMAEPKPGEWLFVRPELGQTWKAYLKRSPLRKSEAQTSIVLQPFAPLSEPAQAQLEAVRAFTEIFFGLPTRLAEPIPLPDSAYVTSRQQYDSAKLLDALAERKPADALIYAGVADKDFFAAGTDNFVFGLGRFDEGLGVYSFKRLWHHGLDPALFLLRSIKLLNHEIGHGFGIYHCIYFLCSMNGSNSLPETDRAPPHFCPVCLRKLQHGCGFELLPRYEALAAWYETHGLEQDAAWVRDRVAQLQASGETTLWSE
jgi:archaemetzincin